MSCHFAPPFDCPNLRNEWYHWQCHLESGDTCTNVIAWPKSHCSTFDLSWPGKCNGSTDDAINIMWCWHYINAPHDQETHVAPHFNFLELRNVMVPLVMLLVSCDTDLNGITWHQHQWHHTMPMPVSQDKKSHVTSNFDCLDLRNVTVTLRMLTASCDANTNANGMTWPERSCDTSFWSSRHNECSVAINNAISTIWCWFCFQWCHMTKKIMLHFILIILTILPLTMLFASHDADTRVSGIIWPRKSCCTSLLSSWSKHVMVLFMML